MSRSSRSRTSPALVCELLIIAALAIAVSFAPFHSSASQSNQNLRFELPANGNLRVENLRGAVIAEVWNEPYVSIAAVTDSGESVRSPAVIESSASLLSVRVTRGAVGSARVNLELRVPKRAHVAIVTVAGPVQVHGVPAALLVQTGSGEIHLDAQAEANSTLIGESKTGSVVSSLAGAPANESQRPQLRARLGAGAGSVRLYSQAGNITVGPILETAAALPSPGALPARRRDLATSEPSPQTPRPELSGSDVSRPGAGIPARPSNTPEEVSEDDVIRVDTELVSVNVSVVDRGTSRGVNDLTKEDFRLYEDNAAQQIQHFESSSAPFNLVLLIDLSGSTTKVVDLIKAAALHFVDAARPFDRIGVITFAGGQVVVSPLTTDHAALHSRIDAIQRPEGSTKLYDSLAFAMEEVARETKDSRRNAIVVISDGLDSVMPNVTGEGSKLTYDQVIRQAKEFDGVIYSIWTDTQSYEPLSPLDIQQETFDLAHDEMRQIADAGGGAFYECWKLDDLAGSYDRVVADLGTLYTLSYRPSNKVRDGSWRAIRVTVDRPNAVARGKRGYFAN